MSVTKRKTFQSLWRSEEEFSPWISGKCGDEKAYCKLCKKRFLVPHGRASLRSHARGMKHKKLLRGKTKRKKSVTKSCSHRNSSDSTEAFNGKLGINVPSSSSSGLQQSTSSTSPTVTQSPPVSFANSSHESTPARRSAVDRSTSPFTVLHESISSTGPIQTVTQSSSVSDRHSADSSHERTSPRNSVADRSETTSRGLYSDFDVPSSSYSKVKPELQKSICSETPMQSSSFSCDPASPHNSVADRSETTSRSLYSDFDIPSWSYSKVKPELQQSICNETPMQSSSFSCDPTSPRSSVADRSDSTSRGSFSTFDAPPSYHSQSRCENRNTGEIVQRIEQMLSQHDLLIKSDSSDFLEICKELLPNTSISPSSRFDLYCSIKNILMDYESKHKRLRTNTKEQLLEAINK